MGVLFSWKAGGKAGVRWRCGESFVNDRHTGEGGRGQGRSNVVALGRLFFGRARHTER